MYVVNFISWVLGMCLSEPQARLSTAHPLFTLSPQVPPEMVSSQCPIVFQDSGPSLFFCQDMQCKQPKVAEGNCFIDDLLLVFLFVSVLELKLSRDFKWSLKLSFPNKGLPFPPCCWSFVRIPKVRGGWGRRPGE